MIRIEERVAQSDSPMFWIYIMAMHEHILNEIVTECIDGTYGYKCVHNCSGQCVNNSPCDKQTGHCGRGCNPGYTDSYCSKGEYTYRSI